MSALSRRVRAALALAALPMLAGACWVLPFGPYRGLGGQEEGFANKVVSTKQSPGRLVASDQTGCQVSDADFQRIEAGEHHFCFWRAEQSDAGGGSAQQPERRVTTSEDVARERATVKAGKARLPKKK